MKGLVDAAVVTGWLAGTLGIGAMELVAVEHFDGLRKSFSHIAGFRRW